LERRNINIGTIVGTDVFGPVSNKCTSLFVDKASGFVKSTFYKWSIRKEISDKELELKIQKYSNLSNGVLIFIN